uniref:Ulp1 protease-like n=1 Tax=Oryza sativa subsp. japonica TaxID=39947 RepID=Q6Z2G5_ORYSJ|nr:hypothetical protein [Oryza sativa Japonica Group]
MANGNGKPREDNGNRRTSFGTWSTWPEGGGDVGAAAVVGAAARRERREVGEGPDRLGRRTSGCDNYQHTPTRSHNIQAYVSQDTLSDIDFGDRHSYSPTVSPDTVRRYESAISDLAGHGFEEEGYPVVDYESDLQTDMSTTVR